MTIDELYEKLRAEMNERLDRIERWLDHIESQLTVLEDNVQAFQEKVARIGLYLKKGVQAHFNEVVGTESHLMTYGDMENKVYQ